MAAESISLFWYPTNGFKKAATFSRLNLRKILKVEKENYGDLLSKYLVQRISKKKVKWYLPGSEEPNFFAIGSILNFCNESSIVWGSGIISKTHAIKSADFRAVRGPISRERILDHGFSCPEIYGDPAILLPDFLSPVVEKDYKIGIVPHYYDYRIVKSLFINVEEVKVIDLMTYDVEKTTSEILRCEKIISSSLHGLIVAHAYRVPAIWAKFSDRLYGDNIKFEDYFRSVHMKPYTGEMIYNRFSVEDLISIVDMNENLPEMERLRELKSSLIKSCPFL